MFTSFPAPLFAGRKRQQIEQGGPSSQMLRPDEEMLDSLMVTPLESDAFSSRSTSPEREIDEEPQLRAKLPEVGDFVQSERMGNLRHQAKLFSEKELRRDLEQHTAFKTYTALDQILDIDNPLEADKKSKNPGQDRYKALRELRAKVDHPIHRLSASSKRYLKSVGIIDQGNRINKATRYDVDNLLKVGPKSQTISLDLPKRSEARTYWQGPRS